MLLENNRFISHVNLNVIKLYKKKINNIHEKINVSRKE